MAAAGGRKLTYECSNGHRWTSVNADGRARRCTKCGEYAWPMNSTGKDDVPKDKRLFGKFRCENCNSHWMSANAWKGYTQKCRGCGEEIEPYELSRLKYQGDDNDNKKPHLQELCAKCKELGYNCRNYLPSQTTTYTSPVSYGAGRTQTTYTHPVSYGAQMTYTSPTSYGTGRAQTTYTHPVSYGAQMTYTSPTSYGAGRAQTTYTRPVSHGTGRAQTTATVQCTII